MRLRISKDFVKLVFLLIVLPIAHSFAGSNDLFTIQFLPPVPTPLGKFDRAMRWMDMNDSGQVTGRAWGSDTDAQAGFLYTPGQGMKLIDPSGSLKVEPWRINNAGQIVGSDFGSDQYKLFIYDPKKGYQSLQTGIIPRDTKRYRLIDMNNNGVIVASSQPDLKGVSHPIRYTPGRGWEDLVIAIRPLNRFSQVSLGVTHINDNGDITFYREHTYVYFAKSDKLIDLSPVANVGDINDFGWVVGTAYDLTAPPVISPIHVRPYVYVPGTGIRNVRPKVTGDTSAWWISADGTVGGYIEKEGYGQTIFTYNQQEGHKIVDEELFRKLLPADMPFDGVNIHSMNDRKEFVGEILTHGDEPHSPSNGAFFWYSPRYGLKGLQKIVSQLQGNVKIVQIEDFNNAGQVLLQVERAGKSAVAILSPTN